MPSPSPPPTAPLRAPVQPLRPAGGAGTGTFRTIGALILREMATTHTRSPGGWIWTVAEPVLTIALLSVAFSFAFVAPPLGSDFALFYATGFLPFMLFLDVSQKVATALRFSRPLLGFASVTWADALIARAAVAVFTQCLISILVLGTLLAIARDASLPDPVLAAHAYAMATALALGAGTLNAYLFPAFPALERIWAVVMRPMFIVSGVVFLLETVPHPLRGWLEWNPLFHVTGEMRAAFYAVYQPTYPDPILIYALSLALMTLGALLLHRFHDEIAQS
ncbi:ABC transporter permease [Alphaproteobacteria bacterium GH1-50]|uniref:Transport permease protein n=1 Tax=Kangsaoukella pontilimi TaxID=2691042 RepID=A0A7C9MHP7_9RHOB|nr:ABC transporter permease [Kangsaoukella pontilimi]MXQ09136.1 ABC transporter permease [Kangsaoukella pontilimi]